MFEPLILTLRMAEREATFFNKLRGNHFPAERNFIDAHITIFHHLPAVERTVIDQALIVATTTTAAIGYRISEMRMLGHGVAYSVVSPQLAKLRTKLALQFKFRLTPQDRASFMPHITVQNKVDPASARALLSELTTGFGPFEALSPGLDLWSYLGGPWRHEGFFPFIAS